MSRWWKDPHIVLTTICGLALVAGLLGSPQWVAYVCVAAGSYFALGSAWSSIQARSLDVNFLMVFAAIGAMVIGRPLDAGALLFLFSLSSTLEGLAMSRTKSAIEGLIKLRPEEALLVTDDGERKVSVSSLKVGDTVRVLPFDQIPADGTLISENAGINESAMTGESLPVEKSQGDRVLAGTQNLESMMMMTVSAEVGDTTLEKIVELVRDAQDNKASGERVSQWFGQRYTLFVIVAFVLSLGIRLALGSVWLEAFGQSIILLVALSPCALVISTPATTLSALAWAARNGILIRGGEFIENAGRVTSLALDKTGTLTMGRPRLAEICVCDSVPQTVGGRAFCQEEEACWPGGNEPMSNEALEVLRLAASAEQYSTHPIALAIVDAARERGLDVPEAHEHQAHAGMGVTALVGEIKVKIGQRRFFESADSPLHQHFAAHVEEIQQKGMTVAILEAQGRMAALGLLDIPRTSAKQVLRQLRTMGVKRIAMITGDTLQTANAVAKELDIDQVHAGLLPDDKTRFIDKQVVDGEIVMMVGDGINDAPSLARAHVGVAMGGLGSDVALNAADIVIMNDKLERLPQLVQLGRSTNATIRANLGFASSMIIGLTIASFVIKLPLPIAVVGHEGSTVLVILNGLRMLRGPRLQSG